jgi:hypothetical protein
MPESKENIAFQPRKSPMLTGRSLDLINSQPTFRVAGILKSSDRMVISRHAYLTAEFEAAEAGSQYLQVTDSHFARASVRDFAESANSWQDAFLPRPNSRVRNSVDRSHSLGYRELPSRFYFPQELMMVDKVSRIAEQVVSNISRRGFLHKGSIAAAGLIGSLFGISTADAKNSEKSAQCCFYICVPHKEGPPIPYYSKQGNSCFDLCKPVFRFRGGDCTLVTHLCIAHDAPCSNRHEPTS